MVDQDVLAPGFQTERCTCFKDHMSASLDLYLLPGLDGQCLIDAGMAVGDA
ncbi:hypothetical protein D3C80_1664900 [compost metagenome]